MTSTPTTEAPRREQPPYRRRQLDASNIHSGKRLLNAARVCDFLSLSDDSLAKLIEDPAEKFPPPVAVLKRERHWALEDLEKWVAQKQLEARKQDKR
jgi:predicted DNA-binding transcriptional regulator AlpA